MGTGGRVGGRTIRAGFLAAWGLGRRFGSGLSLLSGLSAWALEVPTRSEQSTKQLLQSCGAQINDAKFTCYEQAFLATLRHAGVRAAMDALEAVGEVDQDVQRDGHVH